MAAASTSSTPSAWLGCRFHNPPSEIHHPKSTGTSGKQQRKLTMAAKQIAYDVDARERMLRGIQKLARAVKVTLGPSGRVVILEKSFGAPTVTKDGVTVAKEIELDDPYENMGAQMVK